MMTQEELLQGLSLFTLSDHWWYDHGQPTQVPAAGILINKSGKIAIAVNSLFHCLPSRHQLAVLAHEMGHIHHSHPHFIRKIEWECEADDYAVSLGYGKELKEVLSIYSNKESIYRAERL